MPELQVWGTLLKRKKLTHEIKECEKLYKEIGQSFNALDKWSYYIIASNENFESLFGKKANKKRKLYNGMIKCNLYQFFGERPPKTNK